MATPNIPRIIDHKNMRPLLAALQDEPEFQPGPLSRPNLDAWYRREVWLEVPTGELAKDWLTTMALGYRQHDNSQHVGLDGKEGFIAQGLEGKVRIRRDLFGALMALRDIVPERRGRIVTG